MAVAMVMGGMEQIDSFDRNYSVEEDHWKGREFNFTAGGRLEYEAIVREGANVDIITMEQSEYEHYQNQERYEYSPDASALDTVDADVSHEFPEGDYVVVIDNTSAGEASPPSNMVNDVASVELSLTLYA